MRAFVGQLDHVSLMVLGLGAAIGAVWLVALDLGIALAGITLLVGSVGLIVHHRWLEIALLMIGIGFVVQVGYWLFGPPVAPPVITDPDVLDWYGLPIVGEVIAPGMAGLILIAGLIHGAVVAAWDLAEGRRRERLDERHRRRRERQIADSPEA